MKRFALLLILLAGAPGLSFAQAINVPGASTQNPNQVTVSTAYLYYNKMHWAATWSSAAIYNSQDVVLSGGLTYISTQVLNQNNTPASSPLWWTAIGGGGGTWGSITGTLSAQTDLQAALNGKLATGGNAVTATALAATPSQCGGSQFATGITQNGTANCGTPSGAGTVTSVALTMPSWFTIANSPVIAAGTLAVTPTTGQTPHQVIGTCGAAVFFAPCSLVIGDIPTGYPYANLTSKPTIPTVATTTNILKGDGSGNAVASNLAENADGSDNAAKAITWAAPSVPTYNAGGTTTCDWSQSNVCNVVASGGNTTVAFTNPHGSGPYVLNISNDASVRTFTFGGTIPRACVPVVASITSTQVFYFDGTTNYNGYGCGTTETATTFRGSSRAVSGIGASTSGNFWMTADSVNHNLVANVDGTANQSMAFAQAVTANQFLTGFSILTGLFSTQTIAGTANQVDISAGGVISLDPAITVPGSITVLPANGSFKDQIFTPIINTSDATDKLSSSSALQYFSMNSGSAQIPAGTIVAGKMFALTYIIDQVVGTTDGNGVWTPVLCTVAGCGSGTVITLAQTLNSQFCTVSTTCGLRIDLNCIGTAAAGASVIIDCGADARVLGFTNSQLSAIRSGVPTNGILYMNLGYNQVTQTGLSASMVAAYGVWDTR